MKEWRGLREVDARPVDEVPPLVVRAATPSVLRNALELPVLVLVAAVVALLVKSLLAQAFFIPSASMEPQLTAGDRVVVSRLSYRLHDIRRGDVIVFPDPQEDGGGDGGFLPVRLGRDALEALGVVRPDGRELIKRVVALPGETIQSRNGTITVDGLRLDEPYIDEGEFTSDFGPVQIPADHVWVMGDNRDNSQDSRRFGPVPIADVVGRAIARVWPPGRVGFM